MPQVGGDLDLLEEPVGAEDSSQLRTKDFDSDRPVVLEVLGEIHRGHATGAKFFLDGVAVCEGGFETVEKVGHCVLAPLATLLEYGLGS